MTPSPQPDTFCHLPLGSPSCPGTVAPNLVCSTRAYRGWGRGAGRLQGSGPAGSPDCPTPAHSMLRSSAQRTTGALGSSFTGVGRPTHGSGARAELPAGRVRVEFQVLQPGPARQRQGPRRPQPGPRCRGKTPPGHTGRPHRPRRHCVVSCASVPPSGGWALGVWSGSDGLPWKQQHESSSGIGARLQPCCPWNSTSPGPAGTSPVQASAGSRLPSAEPPRPSPNTGHAAAPASFWGRAPADLADVSGEPPHHCSAQLAPTAPTTTQDTPPALASPASPPGPGLSHWRRSRASLRARLALGSPSSPARGFPWGHKAALGQGASLQPPGAPIPRLLEPGGWPSCGTITAAGGVGRAHLTRPHAGAPG